MRADLFLAAAHIRHRRYLPKPHAFSYDMGYLLFDIDAMQQICDRSPWWSYNRFNLISLYEQDLLKPTETTSATSSMPHPVRQALSDALQRQLGYKLGALQPVYVLTLPRYLGFAFNPVSFYWIYSEDHQHLACVAAHITNTPWHEQHLYCFRCTHTATSSASSSPVYRYIFDKQFHVSPFMPMSLDYDWRFKLAQDHTSGPSAIHMQLKKGPQLIFDATMSFRLTPMSRIHQQLFPLRYPLQSLKIVSAIYWQALKLWLKRVPFYTHPRKMPSAGSSS